jgi:hypothetical protein
MSTWLSAPPELQRALRNPAAFFSISEREMGKAQGYIDSGCVRNLVMRPRVTPPAAAHDHNHPAREPGGDAAILAAVAAAAADACELVADVQGGELVRMIAVGPDPCVYCIGLTKDRLWCTCFVLVSCLPLSTLS